MCLRVLEQLLHIDTAILLAINQWHSPLADRIMWIISEKTTWIALYGWLIGLLIWKYPRPNTAARWKWLQKIPVWIVMVVVIVLAVGTADFIASGILKDVVARPRPTRVPELEGVLHLVNGYRSGQYGFVSSHAANTMACGLLFSLIWRKKITTTLLMLWVAANCYSRMYLGVHYPLDIIGGIVVGALMGWAGYAVLSALNVVQSNCKGAGECEARHSTAD